MSLILWATALPTSVWWPTGRPRPRIRSSRPRPPPTGPVAAAFGALRIVAHQVGAAVAAYGTGLTRTVEDTYAPTFLTSGMLRFVAGLLSLFIGCSALSGAPSTALPSAAKA